MATQRQPRAPGAPRPPPRHPPPQTQEELIRDIHARMVRLETRIGRLLEHNGLDARGDPLPPRPTTR